MSSEADPVELSVKRELEATTAVDPRVLLTNWSNSGDEWVRAIVRQVLASGRRLAASDLDDVYELFLQEKGFHPRQLPTENKLAADASSVDPETTLALTSISNVVGVNAIVPGSTIEFNDGLTILFGENGTGKTGYTRILKVMADCRTADEILPDINDPACPTTPSATINYKLGSEDRSTEWKGQRGEAPFTRMSIFDSPAVHFHVDDDLTYVYTPAALALFNHVTHGVRAVQSKLQEEIGQLSGIASGLLGRFNRGSSVYPKIETLGAATNIEELKTLADVGDDANDVLKTLQLATAALRGETLSQQIKIQQRRSRVLAEATAYLQLVGSFKVDDYDSLIKRLGELTVDYSKFREALFEAADLPAAPDDTWEQFVRAGDAYRRHLDELGAHDEERCLYCRQFLSPTASGLIGKYAEYLEDKIAVDIAESESDLNDTTGRLVNAQLSDIGAYVAELEETDPESDDLQDLRSLVAIHEELQVKLKGRSPIGSKLLASVPGLGESLDSQYTTTVEHVAKLQEQLANREEALKAKEAELLEFTDRVELQKSWGEIAGLVDSSQRADRLNTLARKIPPLLKQITDLSKVASAELINQNFEVLFNEERAALRAPAVRLEFSGREGKAQRRKVLKGNHLPSKVLSEGEQKVIALSDFLAETRLVGISAPIIFDDPVSSLDHRHIKELGDRTAKLAEDNQVVVFTHDIFFTTSLLARFEKSKRCSYFQVTDEAGIGRVTRATGPRWDTLANLKKNVNETIDAAKAESGEARAALVQTGYDWIRSWCEVFVECELLAEVTQRYQPNVRMTALAKIKPAALPIAIATVTSVFDDASRYIDAHSQPLASLGVAPTLSDLEQDWARLKDCQKAYREAAE